MNQKRKFINCGALFCLMAVAPLFQSCEKESVQQPNDIDDGNSNVLIFEDYQNYSETRKTFTGFTDAQKKTFAQKNGFTSLGLTSEEFYWSIDFSSFTSKEELLAFIESNSKYLSLSEDADGEISVDPVLSRNQDRYFANPEGLFQVGEKVYKVLNELSVSTSLDNIDLLKEINESNYLQYYEEPIFHFDLIKHESHIMEKSAGLNCGTGDEDRATSGKNRTKFEIWLKAQNSIPANYWVEADVRPKNH